VRREKSQTGTDASGWAVNAALWLLWVAPFALAVHAAEGDGATWARSALDHAQSATSDIEDPFHRAQSLAEIAETRATLGDRQVAMSLLQLAAESADQIDNPALSAALAMEKKRRRKSAERLAKPLPKRLIRFEE